MHMLRLLRYSGLCVAVAVPVTIVACSDGETDDDALPPPSSAMSTSATGSGAGGDGGSGGQGGQGGVYECQPGEATTLALTELQFGTNQVGGWKKVGLNLDGLETTSASTDVCQPQSSGNPNIAYPDGDNGIDNSFGKNLLPIILSIIPSWGSDVNMQIQDGRFNAMLRMLCLPPTGDAPQLETRVFGGTNLGYFPLFNGEDQWPVVPELLSDISDPLSSTLVFENSSVTGQLFDSAPNEDFVLSIPIQIQDNQGTLKLSLHSARVMMTLSDDRKSATGGVIAGVLDTEEVIEQARKVLYLADRCDDPDYDNYILAIRQMSDIMVDGTQDPGQTCNGISFGVHFEMEEVQIGDVGPLAPPDNLCPGMGAPQ
jgi:hypothetical protein